MKNFYKEVLFACCFINISEIQGKVLVKNIGRNDHTASTIKIIFYINSVFYDHLYLKII